MNRALDGLPQRYARIAGGLYLFLGVVALFGEMYVRGSLVFFGCSLFLLGYLVYRSEYLPATIGVLLLIAGSCYVIHSFIQILDPALAGKLFPWSLLPAFPAELGLALWLLVKGIDVPKWEERTAPAAEGPAW